MMMAISLALVGAAAMFAWRLLPATIIAIGESYWELIIVQEILQRDMVLGDQLQNVLANLTLQHFGGGKSILYYKRYTV
jgi:hypothetical protein